MTKRIDIHKPTLIRDIVGNKHFYRLIVLLGILALIKISIALQFELDSEEAQYWLWSNHLQLSYYSKPPLIAYLNWFSTSLLGNSVLGIRINAVIMGFLASVVTYLLAYVLFKNFQTAFSAALVTNIFPFLLHSSILFTPDSLLILFWLCAMLSFWKAIETGKRLWWIFFGISVGLGALSKYTIFLIYIPLLLYSWKYHPEIFRSAGFYLSLAIALLLFTPVIHWNIQQGGVGFLHLVHLSGVYDHTRAAGQVVANLGYFAAGQLVLLLPFYQYPFLVRQFRKKAFTAPEEFLLLPVITMVIFFLIIAIIRRPGVYMNWVMFAYTGMPILFARYALTENRFALNRQILLFMTAGLLVFIGLSLPSNRIAPLGKFNPAGKLIGWSQLAHKIDSINALYPPGNSYVFSTNYHITSELSFYMKGQPEVYFLGMKSRMNQFDLWKGTEQFINTPKTGILVDIERITPEIKQGYRSVLKEDSCTIHHPNGKINTYYIYQVRGMKGFPKHYSSY